MGAQRKRKRRSPKPFTELEDNFVAEHFGRWSNRQIAAALDRSEAGVRHRVKELGLGRATSTPAAEGQSDASEPTHEPKPPPPAGVFSGRTRLERLKALRAMMERGIVNHEVPPQQQPSYYREYRALLKEIDELEGNADDGGGGATGNRSSFAQALERLQDQQRELMEKA